MIKHTVGSKSENMFANFDCWPLVKVINNAMEPNFLLFIH